MQARTLPSPSSVDDVPQEITYENKTYRLFLYGSLTKRVGDVGLNNIGYITIGSECLLGIYQRYQDHIAIYAPVT